MTRVWVPHSTRDAVCDFVDDLSSRTEIPVARIVNWLGLTRSKFYAWRKRYGQGNKHNAEVPRDSWTTPEERAKIVRFFDEHPLEGYRRLAFMMIDRDIVYVSPATVYRVLARAGRLDRWSRRATKKGTGFTQPLRPHQHWHTDIAYLNIGGTFYYLCSVLDGCSRAIIHWEIRPSMTVVDIECILQKALELFPGAKPRLITDNGPQFVAKDFKEFIRITGMNHVRISPYYPQSNGKLERWHRTMKKDAIRRFQPSTIEEARAVVARFVDHYNRVRLHSAIRYVAPMDILEGRADAIVAERARKLQLARAQRAQRTQNCEQAAS